MQQAWYQQQKKMTKQALYADGNVVDEKHAEMTSRAQETCLKKIGCSLML